MIKIAFKNMALGKNVNTKTCYANKEVKATTVFL